MSLVKINRNPSERELRQFRIGLALFGFVIAAVTQWRGASGAVSAGLLVAALLLALASQAVASWRRPIYLAWMRIAVLIGTPISYAVLAIVYFGIVMPIGLILRVVRQPAVPREFDRTAASYWLRRAPVADDQRYFRQF
jgi:hypothetical protein